VKHSPAIWITGVGTASALGTTFGEVGDSLLAGRSGIRRVERFPVADHPSQIAGQLATVPCPPDHEPTAFAGLERLEQLALWCSTAALRDAGLWENRGSVRIGLVLGLGAELLLAWEAGARPVQDTAPGRGSLVHVLVRRLDLSGPAVSVSAACASGNHAIAQARRWLQLGWVDVCLAGACDMAVSPMSLAGFGNLRALTRRNGEPVAASRPFDRDRDGFVMGEGGAVFVLEPAAAARQRSARVYAEVAGFGAASDAHHMVIPSPDPGPAAAAMRRALADAQAAPADVDYVNAHATSTPVGDPAEARVLEAVFGASLRCIPVSATKSMTGHLLTAAAAIEALACLVALERRAVPPTINLDDPDPACRLCHVPHHAREHAVRLAVSNSFGFGGSNTCLVLRAA